MIFRFPFTRWIPTVLVAAVLVFAMTENSNAKDTITTSSGLRYIDYGSGAGEKAAAGDHVIVHYTGWLYNNGEKGNKFDSSVDRGQPFSFPLGEGRVIKGWDEGVAGMRPGGKRTLIIPPALGYGASGAGGVIPPNATLMFDVELIEIR
jgi:FKBP-type peptidyl-prolyl cis-trans isomerase